MIDHAGVVRGPPRGRQSPLLLIPVVWFAMIGTIALLARPDAAEPDPVATAYLDRSIAVVGDSLTVDADSQIRRVLAGAELTVDAVSGRPLDRDSGIDAAPAIAKAAAGRPEVLVVAIGTNDGGAGRDYVDQVADAVDDVDPSTCVVWVGPQRALPGGTDLAPVTRAIAEVASEHPNLHLADWGDRLDGNEAAWQREDGVHLTTTGSWAFARVISDTIITRCLSDVGEATP